MYNAYVSSTLSLRCKGSHSFSFNEYLLNDRFDRNPAPFLSQSCCACCFSSINREPRRNPSLIYGLRQSALIPCSASRRLILGGGDRYYCRFAAYDGGQSCCCGFVKERSVRGRRERLGVGKFRRMISEEKRESHRSSDVDIVEAMLSLMTEEVSEEGFGVRERDLRSWRRVEEEKRGDGTSCRNIKKIDTSGLLKKSNMEREFESVTKESREVDYRQKEDRIKEDKESHSRGEKQRIRKDGSSCSSYYSCSSLGEFESAESDDEVQVRQTYDVDTVKEVKSHGVTKEHGVRLQQGKTALGSYKPSSGVECNWRKKSEKKLSEELTEQTESWNKSLSKYTRQQFDGRDAKSTIDVNIDGEQQQYTMKDDQITEQSESSKNKHFIGIQEIHAGEQNLRVAGTLVQGTENEQTKTPGFISRMDEYVRNSQKLDKVSKIQEMDDRVTSMSERQSEAILKKREDKSTELSSSIHDTEVHCHITGQKDSTSVESRRKFQELTEVSEMHGNHIDYTSASHKQSDTRTENQHFLTSQQAFRTTESRKGSQDKSNISVVQSTNAQLTASQRNTEKRISSQETYSASVVQSTGETTERQNLTEEKVFQIGSRTATQRPTKATSFSEITTKEASTSQAALVLKAQPVDQHIGADVGVGISSKVTVNTPSSQFVERGPLHVEPTSDFPIQEVCSASFESGSVGGARRDETREEPLNVTYQEDALGSADRLQKSSMQFVGEFAEKVRHEVSTSKIQMKLVTEGHKQQQKSSSQYRSGDFKSKKHESRRSSQSSGVKGPSDKTWDVMDTHVQESSVTEAPESFSPTTKTITKRTGRSLWNIISDIVRLRWAPHSDGHNSPQKSGGRSSPNQSASSEAWFSVHELDENSDENVKRGKESMTQCSSSSDQDNLVTIPMGRQGEGSSSVRTYDKKGSRISASGSASIGISLGPTEENVGRSGTEVVASSVSMPSLRLRRSPHTDEISEVGKTDVSASGLLVKQQASDTSLTGKSGTDVPAGKLKRKKLQRNNQVPKDSFDELEEAYVIENEQRRMDEVFMREALLEAKKSADIWEVPVGAVLVQNGRIIARGHNLVEELRDSTAHAEMICIREASNLLRTWRLSETTLYVTLEPCPMCAGAILQARIDTVVWGAPNKLLGADGSWIRLFPNNEVESGNPLGQTDDKPPAPVHPFHPKIVVRRGVLATDCADAMQQFFQRRRKEKKKTDSTPSCLPISNHPLKLLTKMHDAFRFPF